MSIQQLNGAKDFGAYDTTIKDIAGVQEVAIFYRLFDEMTSLGSVGSGVLDQLLSGIRTEKSRAKISWAINKTLLHFYNDNHRALIVDFFSRGAEHDDLRFVFFWHFVLTNRLFREISVKVFAKIYYSGRASISQNDIIPFIKEIKNEAGAPIWSDNTIYRLATKYLSFMTKLNFVTSGRVKSFKHIRPSSEAQVLFLYFANTFSPNTSNILKNDLLPISFIPLEDIQDRLKKLSLKDYFNMNFNGVTLNIELTQSYKGICDVLYK